jgi:hypothetical protein
LENSKQIGTTLKQIKALTYKSQSYGTNAAANKTIRDQGFLTRQEEKDGKMQWVIDQDSMTEM